MLSHPARTVLYAVQSAAGGKLIDFHGWEMPVQFSGIIVEHQAVRSACGVFDLGHMGRLRVSGRGALAFLEQVVCRALADLKPGRVRYGLVLADDGTVEDDVLVSREDAAWHVVVNASNREKLLGLWLPELPADVKLEDLTQREAMLAVQGPTAAALLAGVGLNCTGLPYYGFVDQQWRGVTVRLSRTGYTGEDGYECFIPAERAVELWQAVVAAGALPCGLGARDTLRLEAGMPLYGNELDRTVTPVAAGLSFALNKAGGYRGAAAIAREQASGPARRLVGLVCRERRVPRHGYAVFASEAQQLPGTAAGVVTSGTLSPTLGTALGMAYVDSRLAVPGTVVHINVRGTAVAAEVLALPFYKRR